VVGEQIPMKAADLLGSGPTDSPKVSKYQRSNEAPASLAEETVATE